MLQKTKGGHWGRIRELAATPAGCRQGARLAIVGTSIYTLVNTGDAHSHMAEVTFMDICAVTPRSALLTPSPTILALGSHPYKLTEVRVEGAGPLPIIVVANLHHQLIQVKLSSRVKHNWTIKPID